MKSAALLLAASLLAAATYSGANADFFSFPRWQQLPRELRAMYIAGAFDAYWEFIPSGRAAAHFSGCLESLGFTNTQLADNVLAFATPRADLHGRAVSSILIQYLRWCPKWA